MKDPKAFFKKMLGIIADLVEFDLTPQVLEAYALFMEPHGFSEAAEVLKEMMAEMKPGKNFPSMMEIVRRITGELDDDIQARDASSRIMGAIAKFGYPNQDEAKDYIGELGWIAVERHGGWKNLCEVVDKSNMGMLEAQFRELIKAHIARLRAGIANLAPTLPSSRNMVSDLLNSSPGTKFLEGSAKKNG